MHACAGRYREKLGRPPNATAVQINGNDHYILNSIVFSSRVGVEVNGAADYISGAPGQEVLVTGDCNWQLVIRSL